MRNFPEMVAETSELVEPAIARIGLEGVAMVEAHNVRTLLIDLLEIAQRDPGLDAAADDLHAACLACARAAENGGIGPRQRRLL